MTFGISRQQFSSGIEMSVFTNAGENIQHLTSVRFRVLHAICGDERQAICAGEINQFAIDAVLVANEMPLKFNKNVFAAESIDQKSSAVRGIPGSARLQRDGFGMLPKRTSKTLLSTRITLIENAFVSPLQACAPRSKERDQAFLELG